MNNNELYHYGTPGMKWGRRKGTQERNTSSKAKTKSKSNGKVVFTLPARPKLSKGKKIAIGTAAAGVALASIGTMLASKTVRDHRIASIVAKTFRENM